MPLRSAPRGTSGWPVRPGRHAAEVIARSPVPSAPQLQRLGPSLDHLTCCSSVTDKDWTPPGPAAAARDPLGSACFEEMAGRLQLWQQRYRSTIVPCSAHDAGGLGKWVAAVRRLRRRGQLPEWAAEQLNALGVLWDVDVLTAKWHANFHAAREFKEAHGGGACDLNAELPSDFQCQERPDWVEAARWLGRQRELYRGQKLRDARVRLLKEVLGVRLERAHGPPRRNLHPVLTAENEAFRLEVQARRQEGLAAAGAPPNSQRLPE